jgi:hypothetical protein
LWETTFAFACFFFVFLGVNGAALTTALSLAATFGPEGEVPVAVATLVNDFEMLPREHE